MKSSNNIESKPITYDKNQNFCINCDTAINKNRSISKKTNGMCSKCFSTNIKENEKRKFNKQKTKERKNQRKYKSTNF